jgi:hypothetical protein
MACFSCGNNTAMQQQRHEPQIISPTPGNLRFRRGYAWFIFLAIALLGLMVCWLWSLQRTGIALLLLGELFFLVGLLWWFQQQGKRRRLGESATARPAYYLTEEGLSIIGSPTIGPIPWDEIQAVRDSSFLGVPILKVEGDFRRIRKRLGKQGLWLWLAWVPGGLALNALPFQQKGRSLAAEITAYRENLALVPLEDDPA